MPSDPSDSSDPITGRCYCGAHRFRASRLPQVVAYCHCSDCRRVTGAPVAAFAAFAPQDLAFEPELTRSISVVPNVARWFCQHCGSPIAATYAYLPDQVYVSLGLIDQASDVPPSLHAHADNALSWLCLNDDLPRDQASARARLNAARDE